VAHIFVCVWVVKAGWTLAADVCFGGITPFFGVLSERGGYEWEGFMDESSMGRAVAAKYWM
jgi:hypothetical protein